MTQSSGEEKYAASFVFKEYVDKKDQQKIRDFLYKLAYNLTEAHHYAEILHNMHDFDEDRESISELLFRINLMALQCFALCIRKITDNSSERSVRKLLPLADWPELATEYTGKVVEIYKHYEKFLNKFVVHQDTHSVHDGISFFPDIKIVNNDLSTLRELYEFLCIRLCKGYLRVSPDGHYFGFELEKLLLPEEDFNEQGNYE